MIVFSTRGEPMSAHRMSEHSTSENSRDTSAMRFAFWSWAAIIAVGLVIMIALPLAGR
jgi:hypothetical protein